MTWMGVRRGSERLQELAMKMKMKITMPMTMTAITMEIEDSRMPRLEGRKVPTPSQHQTGPTTATVIETAPTKATKVTMKMKIKPLDQARLLVLRCLPEVLRA